jgi:N-acylneuraminate cytidylyltransferase
MFCGKPMIAWSIEAALQSELFEHIIVSTDDAEIAEVAVTYGASAPFIRPPELANDYVGTTEVVAHATQWSLQQGWPVAAVCCLYATAPFVRVEDLRAGLELLQSGDWAYSFTVTEFASPIFRAFKQLPEGGIEMFFPEHFKTRSQDLPAALYDAGQFYWGRTQSWLDGMHLFSAAARPIKLPRYLVQDIDDAEDWERAEWMFKAMNLEK